ncbi:autotransporter [Limoniibacter endophyticus]|uniref:Autotransporter n=1 Tax=Limoniibacter endophyticus TaxID=1565040 RepID=A0A8J3DEL8_9HYPH|nr:autotransporter [Limoniibacter endophyticus]
MLALLSASALVSPAAMTAASAACGPVPGVPNSYVCDSGILTGNLNMPSGNNTLLFPEGSTGTIEGNVTSGPGADSIIIYSGTITGAVNQGDGIDVFIMYGGSIGSLNQSEALDEFYMYGGRIVGNFSSGDYGEQHGGQIGSVSLLAANNVYIMTDGIIDGTLSAGFGHDTITISGGSIGNRISLSNGNDIINLSGGSVANGILMGNQDDVLNWSGGTVGGSITLGPDNDTARLTGLTDANMPNLSSLTGDVGDDSLILNNVTLSRASIFSQFETVVVTNSSTLGFDGTLVLGDAGTQTGTMTIDAGSTLVGSESTVGGITSFTAGALATINNSGTIDLTRNGSGSSDVFTIAGNYVGNGASLLLQTVLGNDTSPSDKLVISNGAATGSTAITVQNVGGAGGLTTGNGILVVEAINGGTTATGAFGLSGSVSAGAYDYALFRGGVTTDSVENWYLRSSIVTPPPPVAPTDPVVPTPEPAPPPPPAPGVVNPPVPVASVTMPPPTPGASVAAPVLVVPPAPPPTPDNPAPEAPAPHYEPIPLYRVEAPTYAAIPPAAYELALATLGTFHERRGSSDFLASGHAPVAWSRVFGQSTDASWSGGASPSLNGDLFGIQAGLDLMGWEWQNGQRSQLGLFGGYAKLDGDLKGFAMGWNNLDVGTLDIDATSLGLTFTHFTPQGWYVDAVAMYSWFGGEVNSRRDIGIDIDGGGVMLSLEGGHRFSLNENWALLPNAQLIWQDLSIDSASDRISTIAFPDNNGFTGRLGLRLEGDRLWSGAHIRPNLELNLWHSFEDRAEVRMDADRIFTDLSGTSLEIGAGFAADLNEKTSLFGKVDYTFDVDGSDRDSFGGNLGLSFKW